MHHILNVLNCVQLGKVQINSPLHIVVIDAFFFFFEIHTGSFCSHVFSTFTVHLFAEVFLKLYVFCITLFF